MAKEIECKYLVDVNKLSNLKKLRKVRYSYQMYLTNDDSKAVRVVIVVPARSKHDKFFEADLDLNQAKAKITVKSSRNGHTRDEYEYSIPVSDALEMYMNGITKNVIQKVRAYDDETGWDIDFHSGSNSGLVVAEKEFDSEEKLRNAKIPEWAIKDISDCNEMYNCNLAHTPFSELGMDIYHQLIDNNLDDDDEQTSVVDMKRWDKQFYRIGDFIESYKEAANTIEKKGDKKKDSKWNKLMKFKIKLFGFKFKFSISKKK